MAGHLPRGSRREPRLNPDTLSAAVLAGGRSSRMGGDKRLLPFGGTTLLHHVLSLLAPHFTDLFTVGGPAVEGYRHERDVLEGGGNLVAIHAALHHAAGPRVFVIGGDQPFVNLPLIQHLTTLDGDAVVLLHHDRIEPLYAVYSRWCLPAIEASYRAGRRKATGFLDDVRTTMVPEARARDFDPELRCLLNINTPEDYRRALDLEGS